MNRVQFEEAITKCEKAVKKNFAERVLNDLYMFIGTQRQLHKNDTADDLADEMRTYLKAIGSQYGAKVGFFNTENDTHYEHTTT